MCVQAPKPLTATALPVSTCLTAVQEAQIRGQKRYGGGFVRKEKGIKITGQADQPSAPTEAGVAVPALEIACLTDSPIDGTNGTAVNASTADDASTSDLPPLISETGRAA